MEFTENFWQSIAQSLTAFTLLATVFYSRKQVRAARIESELNAYIDMSDRYLELIHKILEIKAFRDKNLNEIADEKYKAYQLFELFSTIYSTKKFQYEVGSVFNDQWMRRMDYMFQKKGIRVLWLKQYHEKKVAKAYGDKFSQYVIKRYFFNLSYPLTKDEGVDYIKEIITVSPFKRIEEQIEFKIDEKVNFSYHK